MQRDTMATTYSYDMNLLDPQPLPKNTPEVPKSRAKRYFFIGASILLVILVFLRHYTLANWAGFGLPNGTTLHPKRAGFFESVKNLIIQSSPVLEGEKDDRINILLLGIGGSGHDGPYLSDTNIIMSIKPSTKEVAMVSVPRDLAVDFGKYGVRKINNADAFGEMAESGQGGNYARQIFEKTFGISIPYYIRVDFTAFKDIVDAVGGIDIDVKKSFTDLEYPNGDKNANGPVCNADPHDTASGCRYVKLHFDAGIQHMDGDTALMFARSRHGDNGEGGDFARAHRQQQVLTALKAKLLSFDTFTNPARIQSIFQSLSTHVTTNLDFSQLMYLGSMGRGISEIKSLTLDDSPNGYLIHSMGESGAYLLRPRQDNFDTINTAIQNIFINTSTPAIGEHIAGIPSSTKPLFPTARIEIKNGTWRAGLAARVEKALEESGFTITAIGNSFKRPIDHTTIYLVNPKISKEVTAALSKEMNAPVGTVLPEWLTPSYDDPFTTRNEAGLKYDENTDILIILGDDFKE